MELVAQYTNDVKQKPLLAMCNRSPPYVAEHCLLVVLLKAPSQGPPGATIFSTEGIRQCFHKDFKGKQGVVGVPGLDPVTLFTIHLIGYAFRMYYRVSFDGFHRL